MMACALLFLAGSLNSRIFLNAAPYGILLLTSVSGLITGMQFPLANRVYLIQFNSITRSAGTIYAADLAGAWLAGMIVTLLTIPMVGLLETTILLLVFKGGSAFMVSYCQPRVT
jgi:spermidine synthase